MTKLYIYYYIKLIIFLILFKINLNPGDWGLGQIPNPHRIETNLKFYFYKN